MLSRGRSLQQTLSFSAALQGTVQSLFPAGTTSLHRVGKLGKGHRGGKGWPEEQDWWAGQRGVICELKSADGINNRCMFGLLMYDPLLAVWQQIREKRCLYSCKLQAPTLPAGSGTSPTCFPWLSPQCCLGTYCFVKVTQQILTFWCPTNPAALLVHWPTEKAMMLHFGH